VHCITLTGIGGWTSGSVWLNFVGGACPANVSSSYSTMVSLESSDAGGKEARRERLDIMGMGGSINYSNVGSDS
jgi:hypothetical protein